MAEKEGFEPSRPLWGLHDFQSCALDQTTRLLHELAQVLPIFDCTGNQLVYYMAWGAQSQEFFQRADGFSSKNNAAFRRFSLSFSSTITAAGEKCAARRGGVCRGGLLHIFFSSPRVSQYGIWGIWMAPEAGKNGETVLHLPWKRAAPPPGIPSAFSQTGSARKVRAAVGTVFGQKSCPLSSRFAPAYRLRSPHW